MGVFNNIRSRRKSFLLFTTVAVLLTALAGYLLMHRLQTDSVQSIQQSIDAWRTTLTVIRWVAIAAVALGWNHLVAWLADATILSRAKATRLTGLRWRAVTWLVLLELVLGQGVLVNAIGLMVRA
ncbi:membrane protein [Alcanivorax nanhaiticus]|uniref:Membrane protein n=1 Tax=Alcanivorax nanhaiticus TaxID=1177154 RepID=A0A095TUU2_9GAMM|nr:membrane protein [Alcanivorax nanhaiticus]